MIVNRLGLHARAASKLVALASRFRAAVELSKDEHHVDAKSIMGVLLLCGTPGSTITVSAWGTDAQAAVDALVALVSDRFGEAE
ncbi:MAG: HPr family phosphocarrier protein [Sandaracinaceae bacterium]|jgi:phosphocarrier protein HPr|nr:HPr family phosphocarrier protein [Sandaracinaceae bacterium]MBK6809919.1 HPr family phosphocarrier protein [Sandaracinaceae bacterium]MBK7156375.1 HPr family phosphocarrier protein [Sandaracinaceae bacterium]MBK7776738.1 HPr family phosphocarrier protein [Sandaracinaceae bacterium]MBK8409930.1 HPr family phosphocarrier protein [Sandaracinaceae bacterium]